MWEIKNILIMGSWKTENWKDIDIFIFKKLSEIYNGIIYIYIKVSILKRQENNNGRSSSFALG